MSSGDDVGVIPAPVLSEPLLPPGLDEYQQQVAFTLRDLLEGEVASVLDVGSGPGDVSSLLRDTTRVVHLDLSLGELARCDGPERVQASVLDLPFPDASFDAVVCNDVLEHLPADVHEQALGELGRVSRDIVVVTVPFAEDLPAAGGDPLGAHHVEHPSRHLCEFDLDDLRAWRIPGAELREIRLSGDLVRARRAVRVGRLEDDTPPARTTFGERVSHLLAAYGHALDFTAGRLELERSEAMVCFSKHTDFPRWTWKHIGRRSVRSLLHVDFTNPLQYTPDFVAGSQWSRWTADRSVRSDARGLLAATPSTGRVSIAVPGVCAGGTAEMVMALDGPVSDLRDDQARIPALHATYADGLDRRCEVSGVAETGPGLVTVTYRVAPDATLTKFGSMFVLEVPPDTPIFSFSVVPTAGAPTDLGADVRPGPNLHLLGSTPVRVSWSFWSAHTGWLPMMADALPSGDAASLASASLWQRPDALDLPLPWRPRATPVAPRRRRVLMVAHLFPWPANPAFGSFVFEQARSMVDTGEIDVRVICPVPFWNTGGKRPRNAVHTLQRYQRTSEAARERVYTLDGVEVQYLPYFVSPTWLIHGDTIARQLVQHLDGIRDFCPDIVHAHSGYLDGYGASRVSRHLDVPLVITEHTGPFSALMAHPVVKWHVEQAYRRAASVLAVSEHQARQMRAHLPSMLHGKIDVQWNGFDPQVFRPAPYRTDHDGPHLLFVGYLVPGKGLDMLIDAFERVRAREPGARLIVVGDAADVRTADDLDWEVHRRGIDHAVTRVGGGSRAQVGELMRLAADMLVLPSEGETFGCVVVEALGAGLPVVSTTSGGPDETLADEPAARLTPVGDADQFAVAILNLWDQRDQPGHLPHEIAARARAKFSYDEITRQLVARYGTLTTGTTR